MYLSSSAQNNSGSLDSDDKRSTSFQRYIIGDKSPNIYNVRILVTNINKLISKKMLYITSVDKQISTDGPENNFFSMHG